MDVPTGEAERWRWVLPWPTGGSVNHIYVRHRDGYTLSKAALAWREHVIYRVRQQAQARREPLAPPQGHLTFTLSAYPPDGRTRDPDNLLKLTLDSVMIALCAQGGDTCVRHVEATMYDPIRADACVIVRLLPWVNPWRGGV